EHELTATLSNRRVAPGDRFRLQDQIAIGVAPDDHDIPIDLENPSGQRTGDYLQKRSDLSYGFHDGLFPWSIPLLESLQFNRLFAQRAAFVEPLPEVIRRSIVSAIR